MKSIDEAVEKVRAEVVRQDERWWEFGNRRPSIRLAFACLEDEVDEARRAYEDDRHDDFCGLGFSATQAELVQVAAIALRLLGTLP